MPLSSSQAWASTTKGIGAVGGNDRHMHTGGEGRGQRRGRCKDGSVGRGKGGGRGHELGGGRKCN